MLSVTVAFLALAWLGRSFVKDRAFFLVALFLAWQFTLKMLGVTFLDVLGPIYSEEVATEVGGTGSSAPLMVLFVMMPLLAIKMALPKKPPRRPPPVEPLPRGLTQADLLVAGFYVFIACLFVDLWRIGQIPLFDRLERFEYQGGIFHQALVSYVFLVGYVIGYAVTRGRILTGQWDVRFAGIVLILFVYLFLTGHRFGSFYVMMTFGLVPVAALPLARRYGIAVAPARASRSAWRRFIASRGALAIFTIALTAIVAVAMANSLLVVRENDVADAMLQRFLVQPVHLYWMTWERLESGQVTSFAEAMHFMFTDPFDAARNTGIQYLMMLHLGLSRASEVYLGQVVDYAGGYPEILIELVGVWLAMAVAIAVAAVLALLYRMSVVSVCRGRVLTSFMSIYVCFGLINFYLGGMINFATTPTYWVKIALLVLVALAEASFERRGRNLIPWVFAGRRRLRRRAAVVTARPSP